MFPFIGGFVGASTTTTTFPPSLAHTAPTHTTRFFPPSLTHTVRTHTTRFFPPSLVHTARTHSTTSVLLFYMAPGTLPRELEEMTSLPTSVILRTPYTVVRLTLSWRSVSVLPEAAQKTIARTAAEVLLPQIIFISYRPGMVQLWTP